MTAVLFVAHTSSPVLAALNVVIGLGLLALGIALSASWAWGHKQESLRYLGAFLLALLVTGALLHADGNVNIPNPVYIPYCDGFWGYIDPMCWLAQ